MYLSAVYTPEAPVRPALWRPTGGRGQALPASFTARRLWGLLTDTVIFAPQLATPPLFLMVWIPHQQEHWSATSLDLWSRLLTCRASVIYLREHKESRFDLDRSSKNTRRFPNVWKSMRPPGLCRDGLSVLQLRGAVSNHTLAFPEMMAGAGQGTQMEIKETQKESCCWTREQKRWAAEMSVQKPRSPTVWQ